MAAPHPENFVRWFRQVAPYVHDWTDPVTRPTGRIASVLTPRTSVAALANGYRAQLHESAIAR